jgi:hypothetical protein
VTRSSGSPARWQIFIGVEGVLLLIAVAMSLTPGRDGSDWSLADLVYEAPTLWQELVGNLVLGNAAAGLLTIAVLAHLAWSRRRSP